MDVAIAVSLTLLVILCVFTTVFLIGRFSHHEE